MYWRDESGWLVNTLLRMPWPWSKAAAGAAEPAAADLSPRREQSGKDFEMEFAK